MSILSLSPLSFLCNLFLITILLTSKSKADNNDQKFHYFCDQNNDRGNYITGDTYSNNLKFAFLRLTYNLKLDNGFTNTIYGENNNKVNLMGICRGDISPQDCRKCLIGSKFNLTQACPNKKEAIGWYEDEKCMLRYSDRSILGLNEIGPAYFAWNLNNATLADQFNVVVKQLLNDLKSKAIKGDSNRKYVVGTLPGPSNDQVIYGLVQCTPDLSGPQCDDCLISSIVEVSRCCSNRIGARIVRPSCNLRFETSYQFYQSSAALASNLP
ncbi:cysteine-rich repeat secretory protein 38-like [Vicia villosa]|uniref:cysteine-rich repeat secretory protein 38-like n=1 Tax=Vicia villosa TaxID=3911 RepID=UPI00273BBCB9|nr:cysteine-rich repeat secretory protein 38-like [Vicia villosa]